MDNQSPSCWNSLDIVAYRTSDFQPHECDEIILCLKYYDFLKCFIIMDSSLHTDLSLTIAQLSPTNITSVVMWQPGSDVITIRKAPSNGPLNRKLDILVGSSRRFFETATTEWQDFQGWSTELNMMLIV